MVQLGNSSDAITKTYDYDAFGNEKNIDVIDTNPMRYCGEYFDKETGTAEGKIAYVKDYTNLLGDGNDRITNQIDDLDKMDSEKWWASTKATAKAILSGVADIITAAGIGKSIGTGAYKTVVGNLIPKDPVNITNNAWSQYNTYQSRSKSFWDYAANFLPGKGTADDIIKAYDTANYYIQWDD